MTFEEWFEDYFCNTQTEDSPYVYFDVKTAWETAEKTTQKKVKDAIKHNKHFNSRYQMDIIVAADLEEELFGDEK
jgi:hypothetical protein